MDLAQTMEEPYPYLHLPLLPRFSMWDLELIQMFGLSLLEPWQVVFREIYRIAFSVEPGD